MPYKKRYKRTTTKRAGYYRHGMNALELATKAIVVASAVKKLINVEKKFHDVHITATAVVETAVITQLTNIPQGDTDITRDGAQVKIWSLFIKYFVSANASAVGTITRHIVVLDRQTNGAIYAIGDLLINTTTQDIINSPVNLDNKFRFTILYDQVHMMGAGGKVISYGKIFRKMEHKLRFESSTPSIADLNFKSLSFVSISNQPTNTPTITMFSRLLYIDN